MKGVALRNRAGHGTESPPVGMVHSSLSAGGMKNRPLTMDNCKISDGFSHRLAKLAFVGHPDVRQRTAIIYAFAVSFQRTKT